MLQSIHSVKGYVYARLFTLLLIINGVAGCASDNIHEPETDGMTPPSGTSGVTYDGKLTTSIPDMQMFEPATCTDYVKLVWKGGSHERADVEIGAFDVNVEMMQSAFNIGTMYIEDVVCTDNGDGSYTLDKPEFACQAGKYYTTGSLNGRYRPGKVELTIEYKPGSMPFLCKSIFEGTSDKEQF